MTAARSHLVCILVSLLTAACAAQAPQTGQAAQPAQATQPPAPIVRPAPRPTPSASQENGSPVSPVPARQTSAPAPGSSSPRPAATAQPAPASIASPAQPIPVPLIPAPPGPFNRTVVFLDAAHGGVDAGSRITDSITEKDVVLQLAFKLRSLLTARGFTVVMSRDSDSATLPNAPDTSLTLDTRAGMGNHARPIACLLLHATGSGHGVHLYSSELEPTRGELNAAPWLTAQAPWVTQSLKLEKSMGEAITRSEMPLVMSRASIRPLDSMTCPALVVELAPNGGNPATIADERYQQRIAAAMAGALIFWSNQAQPPSRLVPMPSSAPVAAPATPGGTLP